jgi:hypothetical protein
MIRLRSRSSPGLWSILSGTALHCPAERRHEMARESPTFAVNSFFWFRIGYLAPAYEYRYGRGAAEVGVDIERPNLAVRDEETLNESLRQPLRVELAVPQELSD